MDFEKVTEHIQNIEPSEEKAEWRFGVVGNIVKTHTDENGNVFSGTKAFTGGTKVYIDGKHWEFDRLGTSVSVIGLNRFGKYEVTNVPMELIENVRCQRIYKPTVLSIMNSLEATDGWDWWKNKAEDRKETEAFVKGYSHLYTLDEQRTK